MRKRLCRRTHFKPVSTLWYPAVLYILDLINSSRIGKSNAEIIRISKPIKEHWSKIKSLDLDELLGDGPYKEQYRREMIEWSDQIRSENPAFFCAEAFKTSTSRDNTYYSLNLPKKKLLTVTKPIAIACDIRRKTDIAYFSSLNTPLITVRISTPDTERILRGWKHQTGIDDVASECDLDNYDKWDCELLNDGESTVDISPIMTKVSALV